MISSVNVSDFLQLSGKLNVIDIRSVEKYNSRHIPGALNIPYDKLIANPSMYLDKSLKYYIYCQHGNTSYNVCRILCSIGYDITNINGGYEAWILSGY